MNSVVGLMGFHELHPYPVPREVLSRLRPAYHTLFVTRNDTSPTDVVNRVNIIHNISPNTQVIVRIWPDDDVTKLSRGLPDWVEVFGPYLHDNYILMIDNEPAVSAESRLDQIVSSYIDIMDYAGNLGKRICWGTWRPGEPADHDTEYEKLLPLFRRNEFWSNQGVEFIYGPHAYFDPNLEWNRKWLNFRQQIFSFDVCDRHNVKRPTTVLIEYGFSRWRDGRLVPEGYKSLGYSAQHYAESLPLFLMPPNEYDESHIVPVCIFAAGAGMGDGWSDFDVHNDAFYANLPFIEYTVENKLDPLPDPLPPPLPTPVPTPVPEPIPDPVPPIPVPTPPPEPTPSTSRLKLSFGVHHENFDDVLLEVQPPVILTMAGSHHATRLAQQLPDTLVIHRGWHDNRLHWTSTPERFVEKHKHLAEHGVVIHTTNEPPNPNNEEEAAQLVWWHGEVIRLSAQYNLKLCILNFGAGGPDIDEWRLYDDLLRVVAENRDRVYLGLHEYAAGVIYSGMEYSDPHLALNGDWRDWAGDHYPFMEISTDVYKFWHTGRYKHLLDYCDDNDINRPQLIFTEFGWDQLTDNISEQFLSDMEEQYPPIAPFDHYRSWHSLLSLWDEWNSSKGNNEFGRDKQLIWANDNLYTEDEVIGLCLFAVSEAADWKQDFDYSDAYALLYYLTDRYAHERGDIIPVPTPVPTPEPDDTPAYELLDDIFDTMINMEIKLSAVREAVKETTHGIDEDINYVQNVIAGIRRRITESENNSG
jgi:hypothetical protein